MSWNVGLKGPIYIYNQLKSPVWDGNSTDENKNLNCGECCLSMTVKHLRDVYIPDDPIHDVIMQQGQTGPSNETQLMNWLQTYCNISATPYYPTDMQNADKTGALDLIYAYLYQNKPLISLGTLTLGTTNYNHWRTCSGLSDSTVTLLDPWYGAQIQQSWTQFKSNFKGILIGIESSRPADL